MDDILFGLLAAFLTIFLNFIIGKPPNFNPSEIFSNYSVWLAKMKLRRFGLYDVLNDQYLTSLKNATTESEKFQIKIDQKKVLFHSAEPFFTWERAAGMCVVCFGFWVSLIFGLCTVGLSYFSLIKIIVISHVTIRLLSKIYDD